MTRTTDFLYPILWLGLTLLAGQVQAQPSIPSHADHGDYFDNFGASLKLSGERLLVSPFRGRTLGESEVFIFRREGADWIREAEFPTGWEGVPSANLPGQAGGRVNTSTIMIHDPWLFLGQPLQTISGQVNSGRVQIYKRTGTNWNLHSTLAPTIAVAGGGFGIANAVDDSWAAIGQYGQNTVHIYKLIGDTWTPAQQINPTGQSSFGSELAFSANQLVIRSLADLHIYAVTGDTWSFSQLLGSSLANSATGHWATDGDLIATKGSQTGISMYRRSSDVWSPDGPGPLTQETGSLRGFAIKDGSVDYLVGYGESVTTVALWARPSPGSWGTGRVITLPYAPPPGVNNSNSTAFFSFALAGDSIFIGARRAAVNRNYGQGLAFEYTNLTSPALHRIFAHGNGVRGDEFGNALSLLPGKLVVGSRGIDSNGIVDGGAVTVLQPMAGIWAASDFVPSPAIGDFDVFGETVSAGGDLMVVGSLEDYQSVDDHGRMRVYRLSPQPTLLCELAPPVATGNARFAWRGASEDTSLESRQIYSPVSDGVNILAVYRNRLYAWRVNGNACDLLGEVDIPGRAALPGATDTYIESDLELGEITNDRVLAYECCGIEESGPTDSKVHVIDFAGGTWNVSHVYNYSVNAFCPGFGGTFVTRSLLQRACQLPSSEWIVLSQSETNGIWSSSQTTVPDMGARESAAGFSGDSLITVDVLADGSTSMKVRNPPTYSTVQTLSATGPCLLRGVSPLLQFSADTIAVPCPTAAVAGARNAGVIDIFQRSSRGTGDFNPVPQRVFGPLNPNIFGFGFEDVP